jgi:hypothetical protein
VVSLRRPYDRKNLLRRVSPFPSALGVTVRALGTRPDERSLHFGATMGQPVIQLSDLEELALIVECDSGVIYTNQAGGTFCMQPKAEGALVPLGNDCHIEDRLHAFFANPDVPAIGLQPAHADALDLILRTPEEPFVVTPTFFLEVDRSRLDDSMEAWLYVTIVACPDEHLIAYTQYRDGTISRTATLSGREWSPDDQPELGPHATLYPFSGFGRRPAVLTWANSD